MNNESSNRKVIVLLELDDDLAEWLKETLEDYTTEYKEDRIAGYERMEGYLNATKIIGKIIEKTAKVERPPKHTICPICKGSLVVETSYSEDE